MQLVDLASVWQGDVTSIRVETKKKIIQDRKIALLPIWIFQEKRRYVCNCFLTHLNKSKSNNYANLRRLVFEMSTCVIIYCKLLNNQWFHQSDPATIFWYHGSMAFKESPQDQPSRCLPQSAIGFLRCFASTTQIWFWNFHFNQVFWVCSEFLTFVPSVHCPRQLG